MFETDQLVQTTGDRTVGFCKAEENTVCSPLSGRTWSPGDHLDFDAGPQPPELVSLKLG